jgi:hypothetical protein
MKARIGQIPTILLLGFLVQTCTKDKVVAPVGPTQMEVVFRITDAVIQTPAEPSDRYAVTFTIVPEVDSLDFNETTFFFAFDSTDKTTTPSPSNELTINVTEGQSVAFGINDPGPPGAFRKFSPPGESGLSPHILNQIATFGSGLETVSPQSGTITLMAYSSPAEWPILILRYEISFSSAESGNAEEDEGDED